ncbi:hypothetical protein [Conexibacter sp. CPCC 206217]|uniref:hypothetical protein n=1 Tax=Conexibacter sp. CPCC 206217 TaxID=3064574 RepID=UPI002728FC94|nr:hypothetical protein [Conexibacter sp. CPCC 206217]MDO8209579.1 hypothetical protein [Conexibacter sp. CPCC 206217]
MHRSSRTLALFAALALAIMALVAPLAGAADSAASSDGVAQASARRGKNGKKRAATCTAKRGKGKPGKGKRGSGKRGRAIASAAKGKRGKAKGKPKRCSKTKATPKQKPNANRPSDRHDRKQGRPSNPRERREQRERERNDRRPTPPTRRAPTVLAPADGIYTAAAAPGLTVTISARGTSARIVYTVAKADFSDAVCQTQDVAVDVPAQLSPSTGGSGITGHVLLLAGTGTADVLGKIAADGTFSLNVNVLVPYAANPGATCSGSKFLTGVLAR